MPKLDRSCTNRKKLRSAASKLVKQPRVFKFVEVGYLSENF